MIQVDIIRFVMLVVGLFGTGYFIGEWCGIERSKRWYDPMIEALRKECGAPDPDKQ